MENYLSLFIEEVISQGWLTILRFNGFILFSYVVGAFFKEFVLMAKEGLFDGVSLVFTAIFLGLSVWCGSFLLSCPYGEVKTVTVLCSLIVVTLGYIAGAPKNRDE